MIELVSERLDRVRERIEKAARRSGRDSQDIALVAVTKSVSFERVAPLLKAGVHLLGENRVQEAQTKYGDLQTRRTPPDVQLHLIGHLQTNKAKKAVGLFDMVQSLDRVELGDVLNRSAEEAGRPLPCLVEVKVSPEASKMGLSPDALDDFLSQAKRWSFLRIRGLMGIAPYAEESELARPFFKTLRHLLEKTKLDVLSMGMSQDFEVAIEEGSTMVRIGTALFGSRT